ncbi:MAG: class II aldolase/adducin family protein [Treponema sp.]|nr:class II aldolase/adducin family protein [Treponema sp.]
MSLERLAAISRFYGADPDYVIAGGGNTSFKDQSTLWVKGSGVSLGEITPDGFVAMDRAKLAAIWDAGYPEDPAEREKAVLADMLASREPGEEHKRPSVETLLHDMLPFACVVHTHPSLVNGLTCSREGEAALRALSGGDPLWIPISDPGFVLASSVREKLAGRVKVPQVIFLQNHGVFVGADTDEEIKAIYSRIITIIKEKITRVPDFSGECDEYGNSGETADLIKKAAGERVVLFRRNREIGRLVKDRAAFAPVSSAYTPDHIVYSGSDPLFLEKGADISSEWKLHSESTGRPPKIAAVEDLGVFGIGSSVDTASLTLELFTDTMKVAAYAESFGGPRFMTPEKIAFINNWEAEHYRRKLTEK